MESKELDTKTRACTSVEATYYVTLQTQAEPILEEIRVGMAEMRVESKQVKLVTSVGSCVAIGIYDPIGRRGGLAHVMLPDSSISPNDLIHAKFADTAVPALANAIAKNGGGKSLLAKIAGGANMFPTVINSGLAIGEKNIDAVKVALTANKIKLIAEEVGGSQGRKVIFNVAAGIMTVKRFGGEVKTL